MLYMWKPILILARLQFAPGWTDDWLWRSARAESSTQSHDLKRIEALRERLRLRIPRSRSLARVGRVRRCH